MKSNAGSSISKILIIVITLGSMIFVSCSDQVCPAHAKQIEKINSSNIEDYNPGKSGIIQSPYTDKHKSKLHSADCVVKL